MQYSTFTSQHKKHFITKLSQQKVYKKFSKEIQIHTNTKYNQMTDPLEKNKMFKKGKRFLTKC